MTRAPFVMREARRGLRRAATARSTTRRSAGGSPTRGSGVFPPESMGETGENVAERYDVSREDQDAFALESQRRWAGRATRRAASPTSSSPVGGARARRASAARHDAREARRAQAGLPRGRHGHRRQRVRHQRRRRRAGDRLGGEGARELGVEPLGVFAGSAVAGRRPARDGHRPGPGRAQAARPHRDRPSTSSTSSS